MNKIRNKLVKAFLPVLVFMTNATAYAEEDPASIGATQVKDFIYKIANLISSVGIAVAVVFIAINGYKIMTSSSNPSKRAEAMSGLAWSIIGAIVAISAKYFAGVVLGLKPA